ncbi:hypothetical protein [Massilia rubra]|uniref:Uncharacterized protein n=1 Tax=Massilia rubra TaxID=2607910 RepID=A0ABX0LZV9_9BURK|nr:hypothetical protein [Massilia rubra]NHZ38313.1 hypothetical protein [Massilia rubra]
MHEANKVTETVANDVLSAVAFHPLHTEAIGWAHCVSDVFAQPKSFLDHASISDEKRKSIHEALEGVSTVLLASFWTSDKKPEPLSGFGKLYTFLVHPENFEIFLAEVSIWRS